MSSASNVNAGRRSRRRLPRRRRRAATPKRRAPAAEGALPARQRRASTRAIRVLSLIGLGFLKPVVAICRGEDPRAHMRQLWLDLGVPMRGHRGVPAGVEPGVAGHPDQPRADSGSRRGLGTDQGAVGRSPGASVKRPRRSTSVRKSAMPRSCARRSDRATSTVRKYTGKPTYIDQIFTSLKTVFAGFLLATLHRGADRHPLRRRARPSTRRSIR